MAEIVTIAKIEVGDRGIPRVILSNGTELVAVEELTVPNDNSGTITMRCAVGLDLSYTQEP